MIDQHKQESNQAQKLAEHQQIFIRKIDQFTHQIIGRSVLEDTSEKIVNEILDRQFNG